MSNILVETSGDGVSLVTLNRPDTLNSMTLEMIDEFHETFDALGRDETCRVILLTGAGRGFCSGHELDEMQATDDGENLSGPVNGIRVQEAFASITTRLISTPQPIIAAVNGPAAGAGLSLALAADTRIAASSAKFNAAFVRLGISGCDVGASYLLPRIVGPTAAFEMMLTGRLVEADEALRSGLVLRVVPDGEVVDAALEIAGQIVRNSPFGVRMTKEVMWANLDASSLHAALALENRTQIMCVQTEDMPEAVAAFVEKRPPEFRNQ